MEVANFVISLLEILLQMLTQVNLYHGNKMHMPKNVETPYFENELEAINCFVFTVAGLVQKCIFVIRKFSHFNTLKVLIALFQLCTRTVKSGLL